MLLSGCGRYGYGRKEWMQNVCGMQVELQFGGGGMAVVWQQVGNMLRAGWAGNNNTTKIH